MGADRSSFSRSPRSRIKVTAFTRSVRPRVRGPAQQWKGRGDYRQCNHESAEHCRPIGGPWNFERYADLRAEVQGCSKQTNHQRNPGYDEKWQCAFQRDHTTQDAERETGEAEQTEWTLALTQPGHDVYGETAGRDDEAGNDNHSSHVLDRRQQPRRGGIERDDRYGSPFEGKGSFE